VRLAHAVEADGVVHLAADQQQGPVDMSKLGHGPAGQRQGGERLVGLHQFARHGEQGP
jgi:hypothetical protein